MAMLAAAERSLAMYEYPPNEVKLCVAGHGHADKAQVKYMVRKTLKLDPAIDLADDAADALAIALCHLGHGRMPNIVDAVERFARRAAPKQAADGAAMIASLSGALAVRDAGRIVVETGGVGYEVLIPLSTYYRLPQLGERVSLEIRQVVREDALHALRIFQRDREARL